MEKGEMKEPLDLCIKSLHCKYNAKLFMIELERSLIPTLMGKIKCSTRYVDDTLCYIKIDSIKY